jgi:type II secretory pathway component GspD/PulD (secretin)
MRGLWTIFVRSSTGVRTPVLLCVLALLALPAVAQELVLEVIQLRYRTVEQVLPVLQPLVPRPGTVSGMQSSLIVRTTRANMADVLRVLESIDQIPRRLMITVRQDADATREDEGAEVSGRIGTGNARVVVPGSGDDRGLTVEGRRGDDRVRARVYGTQSLENDRTTQQLQVLEGNEAYIRVGQSVPVPQRSIVRRVIGGRVVEQVVDSTEYRDALSGFHVRPRVSGDMVTLEVSPQRDTQGSVGPGSLNVQRIATTVSGRLGEWMEIGGVVSGRSAQSSGTVHRTQTATGDNRRVLIKVDEIR